MVFTAYPQKDEDQQLARVVISKGGKLSSTSYAKIRSRPVQKTACMLRETASTRSRRIGLSSDRRTS